MFDRGWNNCENEPFLSIEAQQWPFWRQLLNDLKLVQLEIELFAQDVQAAPGELVNLREIYHRIDRRTSYLSFSAEYTDPEVVFPSTVIPTYGEMTFGAMERVKRCLQELGLGEQSSLLDIGSGYGKPCFHMALETGAAAKATDVFEAALSKYPGRFPPGELLLENSFDFAQALGFDIHILLADACLSDADAWVHHLSGGSGRPLHLLYMETTATTGFYQLLVPAFQFRSRRC